MRDDPAVSPWYRHNLFLYLKESVAANVPDYVRLFRVPEGAPIVDVSPLTYQARKAVVKRLPYWASQALAKAKARVMPGMG